MRATWATRWLAPLLVAWGLGGCQNPSACEEPCDSAHVAQRIAGADAIDCGVATGDGAARAVHACIGSAFAAGSQFFRLVEIPPTAPDGAVLVRGFARGVDGRLREVLGTRQPDRAIVQTRICSSAIVESDEARAHLRCAEPMNGLFVECQCLRERSADAGQSWRSTAALTEVRSPSRSPCDGVGGGACCRHDAHGDGNGLDMAHSASCAPPSRSSRWCSWAARRSACPAQDARGDCLCNLILDTAGTANLPRRS